MAAANKPGKWIDGLGPEMPIADAARRVLAIRLQAIEGLLPLASRAADDDIEHVHQLRVTTRRAEAALRAFEEVLRPKRSRRTRKALRRIRRAAGAARASDVHLIELNALRKAASSARRQTLTALVRWTKRRRVEAQTDVDAAFRRYADGRLERRRERLLQGIDGEGAAAPMGDLARRSLAQTLTSVEEAIATDLLELQHLHELRLRSKQLRYGLEIFAPCLGPEFKPAYAAVARLQEALGRINDLDELAAWTRAFLEDHPACGERNGMEHLDDDTRTAAADLIRELEERRDARVAEFHGAFDADVRDGILDRVRALIDSRQPGRLTEECRP